MAYNACMDKEDQKTKEDIINAAKNHGYEYAVTHLEKDSHHAIVTRHLMKEEGEWRVVSSTIVQP